MGKNELLTWALNYARHGLFIFPCVPGQKRPALKEWQEKSTTDIETIKQWWAQNPDCNIGIDCGKSGILVIDYDEAGGKNGLLVRQKWITEHGSLPPTWTVKTPRGGLHEYYRVQTPAKNRTGLYGSVDVRGAGGLVLAPPSRFEGKPYQWERMPGLFALAEADSRVYTFINPVPETPQRQPYKASERYPEGERTSSLVALAGSLIAKGVSPDAAEAAIRAENETKCEPPLSDEELQREVLPAIYRPEWQKSVFPYRKDRVVDPVLLERIRELEPETSKRYGFSDAGYARIFMDVCGERVAFVEDRKRWFYYDGQRWDENGENKVKELLKQLADALFLYAIGIQDESRRSECLKAWGKWQQLHTRQIILQDAQSIRPLRSTDFDTQPNLLNCQNGTLDLDRMQILAHSPHDRISKLAAVTYDSSARCERWERFIDEVTGGDQELAKFIQKSLGHSLTGDTREECFFILYGASSRNGKSTLTETFSRLMGDYAAAARPETLAKRKLINASGPSEDIARLAGVRFVNMSEPEKNMELNASLVKSLTGRDTITARRLNEGSFEYIPQFKLFLNSNHRPRVDDLTVFASDRLKLIPFNVHFGQDRRDPYLKDKLTSPEALSGILNWCIKGLALMRIEGLKTPAAVAEATEEYRRKEDKLLQFLEEKTEYGEGFEVSLKELHTEYSIFCDENNLFRIGSPRFREQLEERQFQIKRKRPRGSDRTVNATFHVLGLKIKENTQKL